ncbi:MAG: Oxidoreductase, partial [Candidatus Rokubacteria bacterium]|nr:Oxidoreductase [Candidatus Rokubacteria bacterium]
IAAFRVRRHTAIVTERLELDTEQSVESRYGIRVFDELEAALDSFKPELVFVCNPTSLHLDVALPAARAGASLFIEKPLAASLDGAEELARIVEERRLTALVGFQMRFHPCFLRLRQLIAEGAVGRLIAVRARHGEYLPGFHPYEDYRQSYAAREALGGGVILTQIHDIDYLVALAMGGHLSSLEIDVEDVASVSLEMRRDGRALPVHLHQDYVTRPPVRTCSLLGDAGSIEVDFRTPSLTRVGPLGETIESLSFPGFERNQMFVDLLRHLLGCLDGEEKPVVGIRDAMRTQRVALAARESLRTGQVIQTALKGA